jgi:hypothetical protein
LEDAGEYGFVRHFRHSPACFLARQPCWQVFLQADYSAKLRFSTVSDSKEKSTPWVLWLQ